MIICTQSRVIFDDNFENSIHLSLSNWINLVPEYLLNSGNFGNFVNSLKFLQNPIYQDYIFKPKF